MNRAALGIIAGGVFAGAYFGAATANADPSWTPDYDLGDATMRQVGPSSVAWAVPATFTNGTTTLTGTDYLFPSAGGYENEFITSDGALYDQDQWLPGYTNLYYFDPTTFASADVVKTPFGPITLPPLVGGLFKPSDFATLPAVPSAALVASDTGLGQALTLVPGDQLDGVTWTSDYAGLDEASLLQVPGSSSLAWEIPDTTWTSSTGTTLTGTDYVSQTLSFGQYVFGYDNEFVTDDGGVYDQLQFAPGFTNLYYDGPLDGHYPIDVLLTPFGNFDLDDVTSWFTPADYADASVLTPLTALQDSGLYSVLDLALGL